MKLDYSEFHPLDHPIWHPYCRTVDNFAEAPKGWGNHLYHFKLWYDYRWNTPWPKGIPKPKWPLKDTLLDRIDAIKQLMWFK